MINPQIHAIIEHSPAPTRDRKSIDIVRVGYRSDNSPRPVTVLIAVAWGLGYSDCSFEDPARDRTCDVGLSNH